MEAMNKAGLLEGEVSHVCTGRGATLRFLAGDEMPGLTAMIEK
jgi:phosphoglycerate kinase